jgi:hypothetical protein
MIGARVQMTCRTNLLSSALIKVFLTGYIEEGHKRTVADAMAVFHFQPQSERAVEPPFRDSVRGR